MVIRPPIFCVLSRSSIVCIILCFMRQAALYETRHLAFKFQSRNTIFALCDQVDGKKPCCKRQMAGMKNSTSLHRSLLVATVTLKNFAFTEFDGPLTFFMLLQCLLERRIFISQKCKKSTFLDSNYMKLLNHDFKTGVFVQTLIICSLRKQHKNPFYRSRHTFCSIY